MGNLRLQRPRRDQHRRGAVGIVGAADPQRRRARGHDERRRAPQSAPPPGNDRSSARRRPGSSSALRARALGEVKVKGRLQPVGLWRLIGLQASTRPSRDARSSGRADEMQRLQIILTELAHGRGALLMLVGDAGIGKTRLLAELRATRPAASRGWRAAASPTAPSRCTRPSSRCCAAGSASRRARPTSRSARSSARSWVCCRRPGPGRSSVPRPAARDQARRRPGRQPGRARPEELAARLRRAYVAWIGAIASPGAGRARGRGHALGRPVHARARRRSPRARRQRPDPAHRHLADRPGVRRLALRARGLRTSRTARWRSRCGRSRTTRGAAARLAAAEQCARRRPSSPRS